MQAVNLIVGAMLSIVTLCGEGEENQVTPVSVCELIAHRLQKNGHIVAVRGEVKGGGHGSWLAPSDTCHYRLITKGVEWPNVVFLSYPNNQSKNEADHANFRIDWPAIEKAQADVRRTRFNPDTDHIMTTYIGLFVTYTDLDNRVSPGVPGALRLGFGPVGVEAPAQLLIKSARDVVVVHSSSH